MIPLELLLETDGADTSNKSIPLIDLFFFSSRIVTGNVEIDRPHPHHPANATAIDITNDRVHVRDRDRIIDVTNANEFVHHRKIMTKNENVFKWNIYNA